MSTQPQKAITFILPKMLIIGRYHNEFDSGDVLCIDEASLNTTITKAYQFAKDNQFEIAKEWIIDPDAWTVDSQIIQLGEYIKSMRSNLDMLHIICNFQKAKLAVNQGFITHYI